MSDEVLHGGNITPVVRRGDSVHRTSGPCTDTIHRFLNHLRDRGVDWVPQPAGLDAEGREVLSFLPGDVPAYPLPAWVFDDHVLVEAAGMLRQLHDASLDFDREAAIWQVPDHTPPEVICHNDFAPHNLVFADGHVVGAIDFDTASPGPRLWDLAYLATRAVPLSRLEGQRVVQRTQLLLDAYGSDATVAELLEVAIARLWDLAEYSDAKAVELGKPELHEHAQHYRLEAAHLAAVGM